jgi:hypothetical protein
VVVEGVVVGGYEVVEVLGTYVMHEQAELTLFTSLLQFSKLVGIADAAVVVPARNLGQNALASAMNRLSVSSR